MKAKFYGADALKRVARELIAIPRHPDKTSRQPADSLADQLEHIQSLRAQRKHIKGEIDDVSVELDKLEMLAKQFQEVERHPAAEPVPIPAEFTRLSAKDFIEKFPTFVPDLVVQLNDPTVDDQLVRIMTSALDHYGMMSFAENSNAEPAAFRAPASEFRKLAAFKLFTNAILRWFDRSGDYDVSTRETDEKDFEQWTTMYPLATRALARDANLSTRIVESILKKWSDEGRAFFKVDPDEETTGIYLQEQIEPVNNSERILLRWIRKEDEPKKLTATEAIHMRAVKEQYAAISTLSAVTSKAARFGIEQWRDVPMSDFRDNADMLRTAETYCWFPDPMNAVQAAAATIFDSVKMSRDLTNGYSGWWYFQEPLPIQSNSESRAIQALLWSWRDEGLYISAYIGDTPSFHRAGSLVPSQVFMWPEGATLRMAIDDFRNEWLRQYGPGSSHEHLSKRGKLMGVTKSVEACEQMARFFVSACLWVQQKILEYAKGRGIIERHERKRLMRDYHVDHLKDVQIIVLRRRQVVTVNDDGATRVVDWKFRWIVSGHWRNQYYPSLGAYRPKFIMAYPKGPADLPLKVPTHRVYSVSR